MFDELWAALEKKDRSALPKVELVLKDALARGDRFDHETKKAAFDLLRETRMTELLPLVRQLAAMDYRLTSTGGDLYDLVAIREALITLQEWRDPAVIELSLRRLKDDTWIQTVSVRNLRVLEEWKSTPIIQELLANEPKDLDHLLLMRTILEYLVASSRTDDAACGSLRTVQRAYPFCFRGDREPWRCGSLSEDVLALGSRLVCMDL